MANRFGFDSFFGVGVETAWGTRATRTAFLELNNESGGLNPGRQEVPSWRARTLKAFFDNGAKTLKSIGHPLTFEGHELVLRNGLWGYSHTELEVGVRQEHTFTIGTTKPASLTCEVGNSEANAYLYDGAYFRRIELNLPADASASFSGDFVSKPEASAAKSGAPTFPDLTSILVKPSQILVKLDDTATLEFDSASFVIEGGIDEGRPKLHNSADIVEPIPTGRAVITGTLQRDYLDTIAYDKLVSGAAMKIEVLTVGPTLGGGTYTFDILVPKAVVLGDSPTHDGPGIQPETINWQAIDDATDTGIRIKIVNGVADIT